MRRIMAKASQDKQESLARSCTSSARSCIFVTSHGGRHDGAHTHWARTAPIGSCAARPGRKAGILSLSEPWRPCRGPMKSPPALLTASWNARDVLPGGGRRRARHPSEKWLGPLGSWTRSAGPDFAPRLGRRGSSATCATSTIRCSGRIPVHREDTSLSDSQPAGAKGGVAIERQSPRAQAKDRKYGEVTVQGPRNWSERISSRWCAVIWRGSIATSRSEDKEFQELSGIRDSFVKSGK